MSQDVRGGMMGPQTTDPVGPVEGNFYFNISSGRWRWFRNGIWQDATGTDSAINPFDYTDVPQSIPSGSSPVVLRLVTGRGFATIALKGDGGPDVSLYQYVDGGSQQLIAKANVQATVTVAFVSSLTIVARNAGGSPENSSTVSSTGVYQ